MSQDVRSRINGSFVEMYESRSVESFLCEKIAPYKARVKNLGRNALGKKHIVHISNTHWSQVGWLLDFFG